MAFHVRKLLVFIFFIGLSFSVAAQPITSAQIDALVQKTLTTFDVPGIAVAIVKDGKVIHSKGYGVRSILTNQPVDEHTLFGIASNSKAFTSAALGMLIDEGKLNWNDRVTDIIPGFKLYNAYVTQNFTIADLLCHRSGLGLGAGDLMIWPDGNDFTRNDIIHNLRYLKPVSDFRTKYDYDNLLYIVAGEVIAKISGKSWEEFIEERIMKPLQMNESKAAISRVKNNPNVIAPHVPVDGKLQALTINWSETANAAGGIYSNLVDMSKWAILQLNHGKYGEKLDQQLFSERVQQEFWTPHTIQPVFNKGTYNTNFKSYGLGWGLADEMGYKVASHTGGLLGIVTQVTLIPDLQLGIIVLTNQQAGAAFVSITNTIKDAYFGIKGKDRVKEYADRVMANEKRAKEITDKLWKTINESMVSNQKIDNKIYAGSYVDPWLGEVSIFEENGKLRFQSKRSKRLAGEMLFYKGNTFIVKWDDRSLDADAFAIFGLDENGLGNTIKMEAISPLTDFSFDFQDLDFKRKK